MNGFPIEILLMVAGVMAAAGLLVWSAASIRYHITSTHLKISWLGLPVRRLRLDDIKRIGARPVVWAERWPNCWDRGRMLILRRHTGLFRNFVITPRFPYEFRNSLEQARKAFPGSPVESSDTTSPGKASAYPPSGKPPAPTRKAA
jgi:hypothetical protein